MLTYLETRVLLQTGKPLKEHLEQTIHAGKSSRHIAEALEIGETSVRRYAKRYGFKLTKKEINNFWAWR